MRGMTDMMTLILGGSGSGKSSYAEQYIISMAETEQIEKKYYLATMQIYDEEGQKKVDRHKQLRAGKGFDTIEQPMHIAKAVEKMEQGERVALLECMSNLVANEMFAEECSKTEETIVKKIEQEMKFLKESMTHLVVVSNTVFEDGNLYDDTTMAYIRALGKLNERLGKMAEQVIEVVVGIPIVIKGKEKEACT